MSEDRKMLRCYKHASCHNCEECPKCIKGDPPHKRSRGEAINEIEWERFKRLGWSKDEN